MEIALVKDAFAGIAVVNAAVDNVSFAPEVTAKAQFGENVTSY